MNKEEIENYLSSLEETYERDGYDKFLKKAKINSDIPVIHVVGSNGKSATSRYLAAIYNESGYKAGLLTNSYLDSSCECVQVSGVSPSIEELSDFIKENEKLIAKLGLSRWQVLSAFAFSYYKEKKADILILESNLGGDIDPSYIEGEDQRLVILTSLSLEHTSILGTTLSQIGLNKISLLEASRLLIPALDDELSLLLREQAEGVGASFHKVDAYHFEKLINESYTFTYHPYRDLSIPSPAHYLLDDAAFALEASSLLKEEFPVKEEAVYKALGKTRIPLALERIGLNLFDGCSNVEASGKLVRSISPYRRNTIHLLFATEEESNIAAMLPYLSNYCAVTLTSLPGSKHMRKENGYFFYTEDFPYIEDPMEAYRQLREVYPEDFILFSGSKEFAREMRKRFVR